MELPFTLNDLSHEMRLELLRRKLKPLLDEPLVCLSPVHSVMTYFYEGRHPESVVGIEFTLHYGMGNSVNMLITNDEQVGTFTRLHSCYTPKDLDTGRWENKAFCEYVRSVINRLQAEAA